MKTYTAAFIYKQAPKMSHKHKSTSLLFYIVIAYIRFLIHLDSFNFFPKTTDLQMMVAIIKFVRRNSKLENK